MKKLSAILIFLSVFMGLLTIGNSTATEMGSAPTTYTTPSGSSSTTMPSDAVIPRGRIVEQAVCNVDPNSKGEYGADGCREAYTQLPTAMLKQKCSEGTSPQLVGCKPNGGEHTACTNKAGKSGQWCTCEYECKVNWRFK